MLGSIEGKDEKKKEKSSQLKNSSVNLWAISKVICETILKRLTKTIFPHEVLGRDTMGNVSINFQVSAMYILTTKQFHWSHTLAK